MKNCDNFMKALVGFLQKSEKNCSSPHIDVDYMWTSEITSAIIIVSLLALYLKFQYCSELVMLRVNE